MTKSLALPPDIFILDATRGTIRPATPEGDDYFGLAFGSNGTAAIQRRQNVEASVATCGDAALIELGLTWVRFDGRPAVGVTLVPGADSDVSYVSPWGTTT